MPKTLQGPANLGKQEIQTTMEGYYKSKKEAEQILIQAAEKWKNAEIRGIAVCETCLQRKLTKNLVSENNWKTGKWNAVSEIKCTDCINDQIKDVNEMMKKKEFQKEEWAQWNMSFQVHPERCFACRQNKMVKARVNWATMKTEYKCHQCIDDLVDQHGAPDHEKMYGNLTTQELWNEAKKKQASQPVPQRMAIMCPSMVPVPTTPTTTMTMGTPSTGMNKMIMQQQKLLPPPPPRPLGGLLLPPPAGPMNTEGGTSSKVQTAEEGWKVKTEQEKLRQEKMRRTPPTRTTGVSPDQKVTKKQENQDTEKDKEGVQQDQQNPITEKEKEREKKSTKKKEKGRVLKHMKLVPKEEYYNLKWMQMTMNLLRKNRH